MRSLLQCGIGLAAVAGFFALALPVRFANRLDLFDWAALALAALAFAALVVLAIDALRSASRDLKKPFLGVAAALLLLLPVAAHAATAAAAAPAGGTVDLTGAVNLVLGIVGTALLTVLTWGMRQAVGHLGALAGAQAAQAASAYEPQIEAAVASYVQSITAKLEAIADPDMKIRLSNSLVAEAGQTVANLLPQALDTLGLGPADIAAKINAALPPIRAAAPASPPPPPPPAAAPIAGAVAGMMALGLVGFGLSGCAGNSAAVNAQLATIDTCSTNSAVVSSLADLRKQGLLSTTLQTRVDQDIATVDPVCGASSPQAALTGAALTAAQDLSSILAGAQ